MEREWGEAAFWQADLLGEEWGPSSPSQGEPQVEISLQARTCVCQAARVRWKGSDYSRGPGRSQGCSSSKKPAFEESAWPWEARLLALATAVD